MTAEIEPTVAAVALFLVGVTIALMLLIGSLQKSGVVPDGKIKKSFLERR